MKEQELLALANKSMEAYDPTKNYDWRIVRESFMTGVEDYVDKMWHKGDEKPDDYDGTLFIVRSRTTGDVFPVTAFYGLMLNSPDTEIIRWCYISDFLPYELDKILKK